MKKRIIVPGCLILLLAVCVTVLPKTHSKRVVATADNNTYALGDIVSKASGIGDIVSKVNSIGDGGIINDVIGGIVGDSDVSEGLNGVVEGLVDGLTGITVFGNNGTTQVVTYNIETIAPVVTTTTAATTTTEDATETTTAVSTTYGLSVEEGATEVPYGKPTSAISQGEESDGIRWAQWIFIYTDYGLRSDGITGKLDDDTVACIKRVQQESGLTVNGELNEETIDKIELLYKEKSLQGNTTQSTQTSVTASATTATDGEKGSNKTIIIIIVVIVVWAVILGIIITILVLRKKKLKKDVKKSDSENSADDKNEEKTETEKKQSGNIDSLSDLFQEAEEKSKKKKKK